MNAGDEFLSAALRGADAAAPPPPTASNLAETVRSRVRQRRQRRRALVGSVLVITAVASLFPIMRSRFRDLRTDGIATVAPPNSPRDGHPTALAVDLQRIGAEARIQLATARRLASPPRRSRKASPAEDAVASTSPAPAARVAMLRDQAAFTLLTHADRLGGRVNAPEEAIVAYRRVAELFPDSQWAAVATQRAKNLESQNRI
jgi:hypothetical protein